MNCNGLLFIPVRLISRSCCRPKIVGMGSVEKKDKLNIKNEVVVPVEKDTQKLATHVCGSNLFNEGEDIVLKPDSEYPEWLWSMGPPLPLEKLDKNSIEYWVRVTRIREKEIKHLKALQKNKSVHK